MCMIPAGICLHYISKYIKSHLYVSAVVYFPFPAMQKTIGGPMFMNQKICSLGFGGERVSFREILEVLGYESWEKLGF